MPKRKISPAEKTAATSKTPRSATKMAAIVDLLSRPAGATVAEVRALTGWQEHSVRGAFAGVLKKRFGLIIVSEIEERGRVYRVGRADPKA